MLNKLKNALKLYLNIQQELHVVSVIKIKILYLECLATLKHFFSKGK